MIFTGHMLNILNERLKIDAVGFVNYISIKLLTESQKKSVRLSQIL